VIVYGANLHFINVDEIKQAGYRGLPPNKSEGVNNEELYYIRRLDMFTANITQDFKNTSLIFVLQDMVMPKGGKQLIIRGNDRIRYFNTLATDFLRKKYPMVVIWNTARAFSDYVFTHSYDPFMRDNLHMSDTTFRSEMQFFFNYMFKVNCV
jgi:hypothetical protein